MVSTSVCTVVLIGIVAAGTYFQLSRYEENNLRSAKEIAGRAVSTLFASGVSAAVVFEDEDTVAEALGHLAKNEEVVAAGVWAGTNKKVGTRLGNYLREGSPQLKAPEPTNKERVSFAPDQFTITLPVVDEAKTTIAYATVAFSLAKENAKISAIKRQVLLISSGVGVAMVLLLMFASRITVIRPLQRLQSSVLQLGRGEKVEFTSSSNDEVGQLSSAFKEMADTIEERNERINSRNEDMRRVLDNVGQGFLTLDRGALISEEYSAIVEKWFGKPESGETFWSCLERTDRRAVTWFQCSWDQMVDGFLPVEVSMDQLPTQISGNDSIWSIDSIGYQRGR